LLKQYKNMETPSNPFLQPNQPNSNAGTHKVGYRYGGMFLACGVLFVAVNIGLLYGMDRYFPAITFVGLIMLFGGPAFLAFPGGGVAQKPEPKEMGKVLWNNAPTFHKIAWAVWLIGAGVLAFLVMDFFGLSLSDR
jgi:hypothetical protein